jgi:xanthine dehydrogenase YagR molybdenum-binding subunit
LFEPGFGAQFAEVLVDLDLGTIRVNRGVAAFDVGQVLNSKTAHSQLIGGIGYGIGMALLEETHVDAETGRIVNAYIAEYLVPVNADVPDIEATFVANDGRKPNLLGVKEIGELPLSVSLRRLPMRCTVRPVRACVRCRYASRIYRFDAPQFFC